MTTHNLTDVLTSLGYDSNTVRKMIVAADAADIERVDAARAGMTELPTPMQAAVSFSPKQRGLLKQTMGQIRHLSAMTYDLPIDQPVDLPALNRALSKGNGTPQDRIAVKSNLAALGLIA